jgi:hypothetical protein
VPSSKGSRWLLLEEKTTWGMRHRVQRLGLCCNRRRVDMRGLRPANKKPPAAVAVVACLLLDRDSYPSVRPLPARVVAANSNGGRNGRTGEESLHDVDASRPKAPAGSQAWRGRTSAPSGRKAAPLEQQYNRARVPPACWSRNPERRNCPFADDSLRSRTRPLAAPLHYLL